MSDPVNEHGIGLDANNNIVTFTPGPGVGITITNSVVYEAISHTHNAAPGGTLSVFSFFDLQTFATYLFKGNIDGNTFIATISTAKGTHYVLTISDLTKFKDFFFYVVDANTQQNGLKSYNSFNKAHNLDVKYFTHQTNPKIKESDNNNENVLKEFLNFMDEANMGISLFETDATFQNFAKVSLKGNGTIKRDNCK